MRAGARKRPWVVEEGQQRDPLDSMPHCRLRAIAVLVAALLVATACSRGGTTAAPAAPPKPPLSYVAVGASETTGTGADKPEAEAWPRVLANKLGAGGRQVTFTSVGFNGAQVAEARASSAPKVEAIKPNLVTVWLNVNDLINQLRGLGTAAAFEQQLGELVHRVRRDGATTVLVANTPALDRLPAYLDCLDPAGTRCLLPPAFRAFVPRPDALNARVDEFNQMTQRVVQREGAVLVDLHAASLKARAEGREASLVSADGFHPSTAGHAAVADVFFEAAQRAGV